MRSQNKKRDHKSDHGADGAVAAVLIIGITRNQKTSRIKKAGKLHADAISDIGRGKTEAAAVHHAEQQNKGTGKKKELPSAHILRQLILWRRLRG